VLAFPSLWGLGWDSIPCPADTYYYTTLITPCQLDYCLFFAVDVGPIVLGCYVPRTIGAVPGSRCGDYLCAFPGNEIQNAIRARGQPVGQRRRKVFARNKGACDRVQKVFG